MTGPAGSQTQFLTVRSRDEAHAIWRQAVPHRALGSETVSLAQAGSLGQAGARTLAADIVAPVDVPAFDRAMVDGYAVVAADLATASETTPVRLALAGESLACGDAPTRPVRPGEATLIATGGVIPRGADAVVMVEHTDPGGPDHVRVRRPVAPGQGIAYAGSDMARGETVLRAGERLTAPRIGMLAACGIATVPVVRRPRVAILSTGNELVAPGGTLALGQVFDTNAAMIAAAIAENGGEPLPLGIVADDADALEAVLRDALARTDLVILSGGTSKGEGDVSHRVIARLPGPGILVHGVALKPGKPLCLARCGEVPLVILPGFPTSAMFTFHDVVAPLIRTMAGWPAREARERPARLALRAPSELGRTEFVMVSLGDGPDGPVAFPLGKGSGSVTAFAQADGYVVAPATRDALEAGEAVRVTPFADGAAAPDLTILGSHCLGLDRLAARLAARGLSVRLVALGSQGGLAALNRGETPVAAIHLLDPASGAYNAPFLRLGQRLLPGWRRMQGLVFRPGDPRFEGRDADKALAAAPADPECRLVGRNSGAGTRILLDRMLKGARPPGYWNQPKSHNAVAAAIAQGRADWGLAIETVASLYGLGFRPVAEEAYDFAVAEAAWESPIMQALRAALADADVRAELAALGLRPADPGGIRTDPAGDLGKGEAP